MKPIVYYDVDMGYPDLQVCRSATVYIYVHHSNTGRGLIGQQYGRYVHTSPVQSVGANGQFETLNTDYRPNRVISDA